MITESELLTSLERIAAVAHAGAILGAPDSHVTCLTIIGDIESLIQRIGRNKI